MSQPDFSRYRKLLLTRTDRIGDTLVTTPAIRAIRRHLPDARIDMVVSPYNQGAIVGNPYLDRVYTCDFRRPYTLPSLLQIRREYYDAVVAFNSNSRSDSTLVACVRAREKIAVGGLPRLLGGKPYGWIYSWICQYSGRPHVIHDMLARLETLGIPSDSTALDFIVPDGTIQAMAERFPRLPGRMRLAIFIGNIRKTEERWPVEKYRQLTDRLLVSEPDVDIVILAGSADRPLLSAFANMDKSRLSHFVSGSLQETAAFLKICNALVSSSSSPVHLASAMNVPVLVVTKKYSDMVWAPLGERCRSVTPETDTNDVRGLPVDRVEHMVRGFLAEERTRLSVQ